MHVGAAIGDIFSKLSSTGTHIKRSAKHPSPHNHNLLHSQKKDKESHDRSNKRRSTNSRPGSRGRSPTPRHSMIGPTLHLVRHAQGYHNLSIENQQIHDPLLTDFGKEQCRQLQKDFPYSRDIDLIVVSPMKRTIATALLGFADVIKKRNLTLIALPELQELSDVPSDTGSTVEEIEREFPDVRIDLSRVKPGWNSKRMLWAPQKDAIERRARLARVWLSQRPEKNIVVVTHGGFLHYFTEDFTGMTVNDGTGWMNTEFRSYNISASTPEEAHFVETVESRKRRKVDEKSLEDAEKAHLERTISHEQRLQMAGQRAAALAEKLREARRDEIGAYA